MSNAVEVKQGRFVINSVELIASGEDFAYWEIDTKSKYSEIFGYQGNIVWIWPTEHALKLDETSTEQTQIILPERYKDWNIMAEGGRYDIRIVAWKPAGRDSWETVYEREEA